MSGMMRRLIIQSICLVATAALTACGGVAFQLGEKESPEEEAEKAKQNVTIETKPLIVTSDAEPHAFNELTATNVARLEGTFDVTVSVASEISLWIVKFEPKRCGDAASMAPEFKWALLLPEGALGDPTVVPPQQGFTLDAGGTYRLTVKMDSAFGFCDVVQLRFEAHARGV